MARLAATIYVNDPATHQWIVCEAGTEPEPHLAALIRTPSAWEGGQPPEALPDTGPADRDAGDGKTEQEPPGPEPDKKPRARRPAAAKTDT
ncbi:hypothetical protein ACIOJ9_28760 [Streptomyces sp. NPDC088175]|uniref:hypothetical protein n=1 Tax=unclassified Streptomyces TaxID=2593676 RepID=UPI00380EDFC9